MYWDGNGDGKFDCKGIDVFGGDGEETYMTMNAQSKSEFGVR
jgi:hypothetical protein